jgi:hypothetical protein
MENRFCRNLFPKENWLEMLHYFVDMQNKTPQALINPSDGRREKMLKSFVEETSITSITDLNSILKVGTSLILIKAVDTAHLNSDAGQLGIFTTIPPSH